MVKRNAVPVPAALPQQQRGSMTDRVATELYGDPSFTSADDLGHGVLQLTVGAAWLDVDRQRRLACLERAFSLWSAAEGRECVTVRVVDRHGRLLMEERRV